MTAKKPKKTKQPAAKGAKAKKKPIATHATKQPAKKLKPAVVAAKPATKPKKAKRPAAKKHAKVTTKTKKKASAARAAKKPAKLVKRSVVSAKPTKKTKPKKSTAVAQKHTKTKKKPTTKTIRATKKPAKKTTANVVAAKPAKRPFGRINRKWAGIALAATVAATYLLALQAVLQVNLLPTKYLLVAVTVSALIVLGLVVSAVRYTWRSVPKSIALVVLSLVVLLANGYVYSASTSTNNFLATIQGGDYTLESYSIVTKKDYAVTLKNGKNVGYLADDANNTQVLKTTRNKTGADQKAYKELASLTVGLDDRSTDMVVMRSSLLPLLKENYPDFYQKLTVLNTFTVRVKNAASKKNADITKPYAVYIGGIDAYGDIQSVSRSDVNIVAVINPKTHKILLVNTPRDYYVQLHGTTGTRDKLTHAGVYGVDMSRQTLQDLYGVPIDYSVRINFTSMMKIVDSIGGVTVYSDYAFDSWTYTFVKGYNQMDGEAALEFSRNRKAFEGGDRTRGQNQQRVIEAIITKVNNPRSLLEYQSILKSLGDTFETNVTSQTIAKILKQQMNTLGSWQVESISADGTDSQNATYSTGAMQLYVMEPNPESLNAARAKIKAYMKQPL